MKISKPKREIYKQQIRSLMLTKPGISNMALAQQIGLHRNTIPKLLNEIKTENETLMSEKRKKLITNVTNTAITSLGRLEKAAYFADKKFDAKETVMVAKLQWSMVKDLYQLQSLYFGLITPQPFVQVNIQNNR